MEIKSFQNINDITHLNVACLRRQQFTVETRLAMRFWIHAWVFHVLLETKFPPWSVPRLCL